MAHSGRYCFLSCFSWACGSSEVSEVVPGTSPRHALFPTSTSHSSASPSERTSDNARMSKDYKALGGGGKIILSAHVSTLHISSEHLGHPADPDDPIDPKTLKLNAVSDESAETLVGLLLAIKKNTEVAEPGCSAFRVTRFDKQFMIFEE